MKYRVIGLVMLIGVGVFGLGGACEDAAAEMCGPCGDVTLGDATISGDARLDGLFKAVGTLGTATAAVDADFRGNLEALAEVFGSACAVAGPSTCGSLSISDLEAEVKASIEGTISANASGGLKIKYQEPKCSANVNVSVEAQASCEAKAGCEVSAECTGGEVSVSCSGTCSGSCEGTCSVPTCEVAVSGPELACSGECTGSCAVTLEAAAACDGKCEGTCSGDCSAYVENAEGNMECSGTCSGDCTGKCEVSGEAAVNCSGECRGSCKFSGPDAEANCTGELKCEGSCDGSCSGGCEGTATPPSCSADASCEASAECQGSASAQASASLECTPPSLEIAFDFAAGVDAQGQASFLAKMEELKVRMVAIVQGMFKLRALVDVNYAAEIGIESPVTAITGQLNGFVSGGFSGIDVPAGLLPCVVPALQDSVEILGSVVTDTSATVTAQLDFFTIITG